MLLRPLRRSRAAGCPAALKWWRLSPRCGAGPTPRLELHSVGQLHTALEGAQGAQNGVAVRAAGDPPQARRHGHADQLHAGLPQRDGAGGRRKSSHHIKSRHIHLSSPLPSLRLAAVTPCRRYALPPRPHTGGRRGATPGRRDLSAQESRDDQYGARRHRSRRDPGRDGLHGGAPTRRRGCTGRAVVAVPRMAWRPSVAMVTAVAALADGRAATAAATAGSGGAWRSVANVSASTCPRAPVALRAPSRSASSGRRR